MISTYIQMLRRSGLVTVLCVTGLACMPVIAQPGNGPRQPLGDAPVPAENPLTEGKRILGKVLFWEEQLSSDDTVACGTCHRPAAGGADTRLAAHPGADSIFGTADDIVGSSGIRALDENGRQLNDPIFGHDPQVTGRATPSFITSMFDETNFWDGRATDTFVDPLDPDTVIIDSGGALESQAIAPILSTVEMAQQGRDWSDVITKLEGAEPLALASNLPSDMANALQGNVGYPQLFAIAFGDAAITPARIAMAIATYERTLVPNETPWDRFMAGNNSAMTADQVAGWQLFNDENRCSGCHVPPRFNSDRFAAIGLRPPAEDRGRAEVTGDDGERGRFKVPSLRNVGLRKALMHVGWITDVSDALDFYNAGTNDTGHVQFTRNQSNTPGDNGIPINQINVFRDPVERAQVVEFLSNGLTDPRAATESFPFDRPTLASEGRSASGPLRIAGATSDGSFTGAVFSATIAGEDGVESGARFAVNEPLLINARIEVAPVDVGQPADFYCVFSFGGRLFTRDADGNFRAWKGNPADLPVMKSVDQLGTIENLAVTDRISLPGGEFSLYVAYATDDGALRYNAKPVRFTVQ